MSISSLEGSLMKGLKSLLFLSSAVWASGLLPVPDRAPLFPTLLQVDAFADDLADAPAVSPKGKATEQGSTATKSTQLQLSECLTLALEKNYDVRRAREQLEQQHGRVMSTRAQLLPQLSASGQANKIDTDKLAAFQGARFGVDRRWDTAVTIEQNLFAGGKIYESYRREAFIEDATHLSLQAVENDTAALVNQIFYDALLTQEQIKVQEQLVSLREELLVSEKKKLDVGTVSQFSVLQAEVALANSKPSLIQTRNQHRVFLEELRQVLGYETGGGAPSLNLAGTLEFLPTKFELDQALAVAHDERPDLQQMQLLIAAEEAGVAESRADFFPTLSTYGSYSWASSPFSTRFADRLQGWEVGLRTTWKIFDSFDTIGKVTYAQSSLESAKIALQQRQSEVDVAVRKAFSRWLEAKELVEASRKVVQQAEESLRLARKRKEVGSGIQLEVLDAQVQLTEARTNEIKALRDYTISIVTMKQAMGTIIERERSEQPSRGTP